MIFDDVLALGLALDFAVDFAVVLAFTTTAGVLTTGVTLAFEVVEALTAAIWTTIEDLNEVDAALATATTLRIELVVAGFEEEEEVMAALATAATTLTTVTAEVEVVAAFEDVDEEEEEVDEVLEEVEVEEEEEPLAAGATALATTIGEGVEAAIAGMGVEVGTAAKTRLT